MAAKRVLVTRPEGQESGLVAALEARGFYVCHQPLLALEAVDAPDGAERSRILDLDRYQHVIFISSNAVRFGMPWLEAFWPQWPVGLNWYAVGDSTARALANWGVEALTPGANMTSEGLLQLPSLQSVHHERVLIVKGRGGRELLREALQQRGASVDQLACYRRLPVQLEEGELAARLADWQIDVIALSSGQGLDSLLALISREETSKLGRIALLVPSRRVAEQARAVGFERLLVAENATDDAILRALEQWQQDAGEQ